MPSSTVSLEPLSSPSPSPPPPEEAHTLSSNSNQSGPGAGFDSGSELSELTEDEQDNDSNNQIDEEPLPPRRKKKRDSIVPTPMWAWVSKPRKDWRPRHMIEEEEEEEQAGPAKAMEEEEDEDHNDHTPPPALSPPHVLPLDDDDDDIPDVLDIPQDPEDESISVVHPPLPSSNDKDEPLSDDEPEPEVDPERDDAPPAETDARDPSPDPTEEETIEEDKVELPTNSIEATSQQPDPPLQSEDDVEHAPNSATPNAQPTTTTTPTRLSVLDLSLKTVLAPPPDIDTTTQTPMEVDTVEPTPVEPSPPPVLLPPIVPPSEVVDPPSPSASASDASGTPRPSPTPSRTPTPDPESDHEPEIKTPVTRPPVEVITTVTRKAKNTRNTRTRLKRKTKADLVLDPEPEVDLHVEPDDPTVADPDDPEVDSPELELDSDVQPAHRSEALDMLAQIELKFALLRERLYVEKMEGLAWEEALIKEDMHPELSHLHAELSKRRDKRLELASRRREYEVANVTKRRKLDEDGVWSWWKNARDSLQVEMASEANRRRRKLDRERRALDRPQPMRRIPSAPHSIPVPQTLREVIKSLPYDVSDDNLIHKTRKIQGSISYPHLSTLPPEEVVFDIELLRSQRRPPMGFDGPRPGIMGPNPMFGQPPGMPHVFDPFNMALPMMDGPGLNRFGPLPMQHLLPPQLQMQGPTPPGFQIPLGGPSNRMHNHSAPPTAMGNPPHHQMHLEAEMIGRPSSGAPQSGPVQAYHGAVPAPVPIHLPRRSISPMPVSHLNNGMGPSMSGGPSFPGASKPPSWMVAGAPSSSTLSGGTKEGKRLNGSEISVPERERDLGRERISEGTKLRDGRDREIESDREGDRQYHMQHGLPHRHGPLQPAHQHSLAPPSSGHAGQHHHHSHHHHVHHHHHPPSGPSGTGHHQQSMGGPPSMNGFAGSGALSPRASRELELRRPPSGAPMEVIDLIPPPSKPAMPSPMGESSPQEYGNRERGRPPLGPAGPPERTMSSFIMTPSQAANVMVSGFPPSPRHVPPPSTTPGPMGSSRRGSWTEEQGLPRPSSSSSLGPSPSTNLLPSNSAGPSSSNRHTPLARVAMTPPLQPQRTPTMHSPPRSNGIRLPPLSPSAAAERGPMRSPVRVGLGLPPPLSSTGSPPKMSPEMKIRRHSPPPSSSSLRTRSPLNREQVGGGGGGPMNLVGNSSGHAANINPRTSSPITIFPPPSSLSAPSPLPPPRLSTGSVVGGVGSGRHSPGLVNPPKMNAVPPIDGS